MKKITDCPYCDGHVQLEKEPREFDYRKEFFKVVAHYYKCQKCKEEFTTNEIDTVTVLQVHNQYREKYGIPF